VRSILQALRSYGGTGSSDPTDSIDSPGKSEG
jgi:hypothetical protein